MPWKVLAPKRGTLSVKRNPADYGVHIARPRNSLCEHILIKLRKIKGVKRFVGVCGAYDIYTKGEAETIREIKNIILKQIKRLKQNSAHNGDSARKVSK